MLSIEQLLGPLELGGAGGRGAFLKEKVQLKYGLKFRGVDLTHCPPVPTALVIKLLHIKSDSFLTTLYSYKITHSN